METKAVQPRRIINSVGLVWPAKFQISLYLDVPSSVFFLFIAVLYDPVGFRVHCCVLIPIKEETVIIYRGERPENLEKVTIVYIEVKKKKISV